MDELVWMPTECHIHYVMGRSAWEAENMAEDYKTLREVSVAVSGVKDTISIYAKVAAGFATAAMAIAAYLVIQGSALNGTVNRIDERTQNIEKRLDSMDSTLKEIQTHMSAPQRASFNAGPNNDSFPGWIGTSAKGGEKAVIEALPDATRKGEPTWIFTPKR